MTLTKIQFKITFADDFARGCTSSLFDLKQQLAQLKVTQIASTNLSGIFDKQGKVDNGSFDIAGKLNCLKWNEMTPNQIQKNINNGKLRVK